MSSNPIEGDLRVWWIPQVPMEAFYVPIKNIDEAKLLIHTLADYDIFQFKNNIKPDYSNTGGLQKYNGTEWEEYEDDDERSIDEIMGQK